MLRGEVQFAMRNGEDRDPRQWAELFSVITARFNPENGGYTPISHGNSYIQTVTWDEGVPDADAILTYSQSPEPDSSYYRLTKLYSKRLGRFAFTDSRSRLSL